MKKTFLSILFLLAACLALLSTAALATEPTTILVSNETGLKAALEDATENAADIVQLSDSFSISSKITVARKVTLDLSGKTLTWNSTSTGVYSMFDVLAGGDMTLKDSNTGGKLDCSGKVRGFFVNKGSLCMEGGQIANGYNSSAGYGGGILVTGENGSLTMKGGSFVNCKSGNDGGTYNSIGMSGDNNSYVHNYVTLDNVTLLQGKVTNYDGATFSGGTFGGDTGRSCNVTNQSGATFSGDLVNGTIINSGTISGGTFGNSALINVTNSGSGIIEGGSFQKACRVFNSGTISGGTFNADEDRDVVNGGTITGGTFQKSVKNYNSSNCGTITGGIFETGSKVYNGYESDINGTCSITGGTFKGTVYNGSATDKAHGTITGGTFADTCTVENYATGTIQGYTPSTTGSAVQIKNLVVNGGSIKLSDSIGTLSSLKVGTGVTLTSLLNDGYAYQRKTGASDDWTMLTRNEVGTATELTGSVQVVRCGIHQLEQNACIYCGASCLHTDIDTNGKCSNCGAPIVATVTIGGETSNCISLNGISTLIDGKSATVTLLADASGNISVSSGTIALDLNGKTLTGGLTVTGGSVSVYDSTGGKITGAVSLTKGYLTLNGGTYSGNVTASGGTLAITGGSFKSVTVSGGSATITGGSFEEIKNSKTGGKVTDLLGENVAFANSHDESRVGNLNVASLQNVKVISHTNHTDEDGSVGSCDFCGKELYAKVTSGETTTYYDSFSSALNNVGNGQTVKLLRLTSLTQNTTISGKSFILDLGEKWISGNEISTGKLIIASGAGLTLKGTSGKLEIPVDVNGTLTVADAVKLTNEVSVAGGKITVNADAAFTSLSITGGTATLESGTFATLSVGTEEKLKNKNFLGTDRAYYDTANGKWLTDTDLNTDRLSDVSVKEPPIKSVSISTNDSKTSFAYGEEVKLTATASLAADYSESAVSYAWENAGSTGQDLGSTQTITRDDLAPNNYNFKCTVTVDGYSLSENIEFTVSKATLTEGTHYTAPTAKTDLTYIDGSDQVLVNAGSFKSNVTTTGSNAPSFQYGLKNASGVMQWGNAQSSRNAGTYTVYWYIAGGTNYNDVGSAQDPAGSVEVTIAKATPTASDFTAANLTATYDGTAKTAKVTPASGVTGMGAVTVKYFKGDSAVTPTNAGAYTVKISVAVGDNYTAASDLTDNWTFTIGKASFSGSSPNYGVSVKKNTAHSYTYDLVDFLPGLPENCSYGQIRYAIGPSTLLSDFYDGNATIDNDNGILTLPIKSYAGSGNTGKLTITVTSDNYEPIDLQISPNFIEGTPLNGVPTLSRTGLTYGEKLSAITLSGTMTDALTGASVPGTFSWNNSEFKPASVGLMEASWDFTPADSSTYQAANGTVRLTVLKATPTGEPSYTAITTSGKKLSDANLQIGTITPAGGTIAWELDGDTEVTANTAYNWTYTPAESDQANYNTRSGSITPYRVSTPSGGGGGSSSGSTSSSTTVTVPVSSDHASVEVKAEVSKGNATVEISDKQIEEVAQHGSGTVTVDVSKLEKVESVQVPAHVVETTNKAEDTGLTVALPAGSVTLDETALESVTEAAGGKDVTVSVVSVPTEKLPTAVKEIIGMEPTVVAVVDVNITVGNAKQSSFSGGKVTISVPYTPKKGEDTGKLTVWFIKDDGTIENKGGYYDAEKKCFVFETEHLSQYLLVNTNELVSFTDVPANAYYAAAVNWAAKQNITGGIGNNLFAPDASCTRAQIVTFLWRAAGCPVVNFAMNFSDVDEVAFYGEAVRWAASLRIVGGYGDGLFGTNDAITREQMAAILYRYAQSVGMDTTQGGMAVREFTDYESVSDYARDAMRWAVNAGIIQGANGKLMPSDECTRGQIVTMLYRLLGE